MQTKIVSKEIEIKESEIIEIATNTNAMDFLSDYLDISGCGEFIQINDNQNGTYIINGDKKILIDSQVTGNQFLFWHFHLRTS